MEIVLSVAGKIMDCLFNAAGHQLGYLQNYGDNIEALEKQVKKLKGSRDRVQANIDVAKRNGEIIMVDVENWIAEVDKIYAEAEKFLQEEVKADKRCLNGWCINPKQRYRLSKEAKRKIQEISQLQDEGKFENVSCPASLPKIMLSSKVFSGTFESRQLIMKQIIDALEDNNVNIIGLCGMGGVGKTTLVKEIGKQAKEGKLYDVVVMAVASQAPSILNIQGEIAHMLGLKEFPENVELARASSLFERIKMEKRILVILDDLWSRIELEKIGIPFGNDHGGCKIILTSRSKNVCIQMDCDKIFPVDTLTMQESWVLFSEILGWDVENSDLSPIAREIVTRCGGLPIAIVTIARALKNKNKHVWRDAARQLKKSSISNIEGMHGSVITSLELSYNYLESEEAKSLFLFCSLFPEDFRIPVEDLLRYGMGLRWFKNIESMEDVRDRAHTVVSTLISCFLLIDYDDGDSDDDDKDEIEFVKMHDVIREVAITIAPKNKHMFMARAGTGLREWPSEGTFEHLTCISLISNNIQEVPDRLECPKLQTLLLQGNSELVVPNGFFQAMKDLKVLNLSGTRLLPLPESLSLLTNLRTLCLDYCMLGDLSTIGMLSNLEILSLSSSYIEEIPISFCQLSHLRLLDLNKCENLTLISHGVISCLCKLEELYMVNSFKNWDIDRQGDLRSNAKLVELKALSRLTSLQICIPNTDIFPNDMFPFQNLTYFFLSIGVKYNEGGEISRYSRTIKLENMSISRIPGWVKILLKRTKDLFLSEIFDSENILLDLVREGLDYLKYLQIKSYDMKYLLNTSEWIPNSTFHNLEVLRMYANSNLVEICHGLTPAQCFSKLKYLEIGNCSKLRNLFTPSIVERLVKLEGLLVCDCFTIQEIVTSEEGEKGASTKRIVFPSLYHMRLIHLDSLTCFSSGLYVIEFPALERLFIYECSKMKTFGYGDQVTPKLNKIWLEGYRWNGNLNATVQQFFNEQEMKRIEKEEAQLAGGLPEN